MKKKIQSLCLSCTVLLIALSDGAWAATGVNWGGGSGGTEAEPLDVYDLANWSGVSALSDAYNLTFDAGNKPTVLTNTAPAGTKIANNINLKYGTWTLLGDYKFSTFDTLASGTEPKTATIVKKGDWELTWAAYFGRGGATTILTNVSGKIEQTAAKWFQIGNGGDGLAVVENLSGDWTLAGQLAVGHGKGSAGEIYWRGGDFESTNASGSNFALGANTTAQVEKDDGDWTLKKLTLGDGAESEATFIHRGGSMTVSVDFIASAGSNSVVTIEKDAGDWTLATFKLGQGANNVYSEAKTTFRHNGGATSVSGRFDMSNFGSCDFYMNGGSVTAGEVWFGTWMLKNKWHHATIHLAGGVFAAKCFYLHNSDNAKLSKVVFDGGTFRATTSGNMIYGNSSRYNLDDSSKLSDLRNRFGVEVGPRGGTIDTAGYNITNVVNFTRTSGSAGGMRFLGGGSVVLTGSVGYTGLTSVEAGTTLEATDSTAAANILANGLDVTGYPATGDYTVFRCGDGKTLSEADLAKVTCLCSPESTFAIGENGKAIVMSYVQPAGVYWTGAANDNNLSTPGNWSDGAVPASGNPTIYLSTAATLVVGDVFSPDTLTIPESSAVVTLAGSLTVSALTNACKLAVADGATLTVTGDLVGYAATNDPKPLLHSNHGTVTVGGKVHFRSNGTSSGNSIVYQYAVADADSKPIAAAGLAYNADSWSDYLVANLGSMDNGSGKWVVGAAGLTIPYSRNIDRSGFRVTGSQSAILHSSADWALDESYRHMGNDLLILDTATVTIDTADWNGGSVGHTVTLEGYVNAKGTAASPLSVTGNGKVVLAAVPANGNTNIVNGALSVAGGATLEIKSGVDVAGTGTISLAAGATLALPANADRTFTTPYIVPVTLPSDGKATIRIDGRRLEGDVDHVLLNSVPEGYEDHLMVAGTAIAERRVSLKAVEGKLMLNIEPKGLTVILK